MPRKAARLPALIRTFCPGLTFRRDAPSEIPCLVRRCDVPPLELLCTGTPNGSAASPIRSGIPLLRGTSSEGDSVRGSPCDAPARLRTGLQGPIPSDPGIRGPLHPLRLRCPPSPYRAGTPRLGASPEAAHRPSRCTASSGTDPWTPASLRPPPAAATPATKDPGRCGGFHEAACGARNGNRREAASGTRAEPAASGRRSRA